jgi:hypothetical protein
MVYPTQGKVLRIFHLLPGLGKSWLDQHSDLVSDSDVVFGIRSEADWHAKMDRHPAQNLVDELLEAVPSPTIIVTNDHRLTPCSVLPKTYKEYERLAHRRGDLTSKPLEAWYRDIVTNRDRQLIFAADPQGFILDLAARRADNEKED